MSPAKKFTSTSGATDTFVDFQRGINFSINQIRAALGDNADKPRYIETIPRCGYRFIHPIEVSQEAIDQREQDAQPARPAAAPIESLGPPAKSLEPATMPEAPKSTESEVNPDRWKLRRWLLSGLGFATLLILIAVFFSERYGGLRLQGHRLARAKTLAPRGHSTLLTNFRGVAMDPEFSRHAKNDATAESNRAFAEAHILSIANSFISDDPLRRSFLSALPVRRVLDRAAIPALANQRA